MGHVVLIIESESQGADWTTDVESENVAPSRPLVLVDRRLGSLLLVSDPGDHVGVHAAEPLGALSDFRHVRLDDECSRGHPFRLLIK